MCDTSFELKINVGPSVLYFTVQLFYLLSLVLLAKRASGKLCGPAIALIQ